MHDRSSLAEPVKDALAAQAARNERAVAATGAVFGVLGVAISLVLWLAPSPTMEAFQRDVAPSIFGVTLALALWYATSSLLLARGVGGRIVPWVSTFIEASYPGGLMWMEARSQSPGYVTWTTLGPWIQIVAFLLAILRLRWEFLLIVGVLGSLEYGSLLLYAVPRLPVIAGDPTLGAPLLYAMRPVVILAAGALGAMVVRRLRATVGRVHTEVRSQELFGKYRLGDLLAAGGMGEVYEATYCPEGGFQKRVAVKRIHPHLAGDARFVEGFRREAELGSHLAHPNIVQVLDFGMEGGGYFLAMEFVDGLTLSELMRRARARQLPLPAPLVAWVGRQIGNALAFAHSEARDASGGRLRVIHRDLSPANVLLSRAGEVKVTDFGVAKALGEKEDTVTGSVVGKLAYMAPEQMLGEPTDERCDLFALGVVLWEALCGQRLFRGSHDAATILEVLNRDVPPVGDARPDLRSPGWDAFLARALCRSRDGRFCSASELATALDEIRDEEGAFSAEAMAAYVCSCLADGPTSSVPSLGASPFPAHDPAHENETKRSAGHAFGDDTVRAPAELQTRALD